MRCEDTGKCEAAIQLTGLLGVLCHDGSFGSKMYAVGKSFHLDLLGQIVRRLHDAD